MIYNKSMSDIEADVDKLESAIRLFAQSIKRPQRWAQITAATGINLDRPSAIVLHTLRVNEPKLMRVQDLAQSLGIEPPSVTRKTQLLEELGYITRQSDANDKRAVCLKVTPKGNEISQRLWDAQRQNLLKVLERWDPDERRQLVTLFERFSQELNETN